MDDPSQNALPEWFQSKAADPKFIQEVLASLERGKIGATVKLRQLEKIGGGSLEDIRYQRGFLDGVQSFFDVLDRVRSSESKKPLGSGLISRILKLGDTNARAG